MTRERFEYLFEEYRNDRLSQEDWDELRMAIRGGLYNTWLQDDFLRALERGGTHDSWTPEVEEAVWQQIMKGRHPMRGVEGDEIPLQPVKAGTLIRGLVIRYVAVAASILLIFMTMRFFRSSSHHEASPASTQAHRNTNDVLPGGDKAILTLADGTRIELDSVQNGQIARQGKSVFNKTNGALTISSLTGKISGGTPQSEPVDGSEAFITTPRGGQYQLILPDGSKVWLNSASSLRFPTVFKGKERAVELSGEGYFEIVKNAKMPFSVSVNHMKVQVLGTHFNTMAYPDEKTINTTLLEGAVEVSEGDLTKRLIPGQQAALNSASHQLAVRKADIQKTMAWKNGLFEFDNTDLQTIMRQLARWYDIEIIYLVTPDKTPLGGSISRRLNLAEVLTLLESNGINHFRIEGKKVYVLS